jgi:hypothetical protein
MFSGILIIRFINKFGLVFLLSKSKKKVKDESTENGEFTNLLTCKFVFDGADKKIGESLAVDKDILIIKSGKKYLGVPIKHIEIQDKILIVKGLIERDKAEKMGEKWQQASFREMDFCEKKE